MPLSIWMKTFYNKQAPKLDAQNATMFSLHIHQLLEKMILSLSWLTRLTLKKFLKKQWPTKPSKIWGLI